MLCKHADLSGLPHPLLKVSLILLCTVLSLAHPRGFPHYCCLGLDSLRVVALVRLRILGNLLLKRLDSALQLCEVHADCSHDLVDGWIDDPCVAPELDLLS